MQDDMDVGTMDLQNDGEEGSGGELQSRASRLKAQMTLGLSRDGGKNRQNRFRNEATRSAHPKP